MDNEKLLQNAQNNLQFNDAYLKSTNCFTGDDFDPKATNWEKIAYQFIHVVKGSEVVSVIDDENEEIYYFRVFVKVGCRFIDNEDRDKDEPDILSRIEAIFCSEYMMRDKTRDEDELKIFALKNASYHIWPFWREYLLNMCNRLNLPKVALPTMHLNPQNGVKD